MVLDTIIGSIYGHVCGWIGATQSAPLERWTGRRGNLTFVSRVGMQGRRYALLGVRGLVPAERSERLYTLDARLVLGVPLHRYARRRSIKYLYQHAMFWYMRLGVLQDTRREH